MNREWKPGDVAMAAGEYVVYADNGVWFWAETGLACANQPPRDLRPLAVIDPEDREAVERLAKAMHESDHIAPWHDLHNETRSQIECAMQAALREFANPTPPKPDEPQGLGAVVEDADGRKFVRVAEPFDGWAKDNDWQRIGGNINAVRNFGWSDIAAVRILSPGVTS